MLEVGLSCRRFFVVCDDVVVKPCIFYWFFVDAWPLWATSHAVYLRGLVVTRDKAERVLWVYVHG